MVRSDAARRWGKRRIDSVESWWRRSIDYTHPASRFCEELIGISAEFPSKELTRSVVA